jgi:hypothetical protein
MQRGSQQKYASIWASLTIGGNIANSECKTEINCQKNNKESDNNWLAQIVLIEKLHTIP